ncbi:hypothetical protein Leryth_017426 [Lithospermum erythrorhizon]|nr:hypothetical protein Leryth_017426 [Lithospermum erythrorhizon]
MKDRNVGLESGNNCCPRAYRRHEENLASAMSLMARLLQGRPMPIDKLRIMFKTTQDLQDFDCCAEQPPYMIFEQLNTRELEQLHDDVKFDLDYISRAESTTGIMRQCWEALLDVCQGELKITEIPLLEFFKAKIFLKENNHGCKILGKRLMLEDKMPHVDRRMMDKVQSGRVAELGKRFGYSPVVSEVSTWYSNYKEESEKLKEMAIIAMGTAGESGSKHRMLKIPDYPPRLEYEWKDKYLPRRPTYLNRVEYGHRLDSYDLAGLNPYVEKAYKFNIFYPNIVDQRNLQFFIEYEKDNTKTCRLIFQAGPPYQDIAFRIVNQEWDLKAFKSSFQHGILHLYFNLKGYWYHH